jgi:hypothetical protein
MAATISVSGKQGPFPQELRALGWLVAFELLLGVWSSLHAEQLRAVFLSQIPMLGVAGAIWGLLPGRPKGALSEWVARAMASPALATTFRLMTLAGVAFTSVYTTVAVKSVDPNAAATMYFVAGSTGPAWAATCGGTSAPPAVPTGDAPRPERLNRLTTPLDFSVWTPPWGRAVWMYTPTQVSREPVRALPWVHATVQYPDDFEPMTTLAVLPMPTEGMTRPFRHKDTLALVLLDERRPDTVAVACLTSAARVDVAFTQPAKLAPANADGLRARWVDSLRLALPRRDSAGAAAAIDSAMMATADSINRLTVERMWMRTAWSPARRPLRDGEVIRWELWSTKEKKRLANGEVTLAGDYTDLRLSP